MLKINSLNKYYNKDKQNELHVLKNVDISLPSSGMVAFFGKSGCGKTTLLNMIGGLDTSDSGSVEIEGKNYSKNADDVRNEYVGYIFQNYNLIRSETCFDNVANALRLCGVTDEDVIEKRTLAALKNVGMEKFGKRYPDTLSGGQMQRIAIARAIVKGARIILADEPTGNLDEANTVMIMDLLRAVAKDHLVLLVTHEEKLVDSYCDKVVELKDGEIVNVRDNEIDGGASIKDKNDVYLGELEKSEINADGISIELYGSTPEKPISFKIINDGQRLLLKVETAGVRVIDNTSEIRLKEGKYEPRATKNRMSEDLDLSDLGKIDGQRWGRLFGFRKAFTAGVKNIWRKKGNKKGQVMIGCLLAFSLLVVFLCSVFGTRIKELEDARNKNHSSVFYVLTDTEELSNKLYAARGNAESGIDFVQLKYGYIYGDEGVYLRVGGFESFNISGYYDRLTSHGVYLPVSAMTSSKIVAGTATPDEHGVVLTTRIADELLETSALGHITSYDDLLGMYLSTYAYDSRSFFVSGIVESDMPEVYLNDIAMARDINSSNPTAFELASDYGIDLNEGECLLVLTRAEDVTTLPEVNSTVKLEALKLNLKGIEEYCTSYDAWILKYHPEILAPEAYFKALAKETAPGLSEKSDEFEAIYLQLYDDGYFEYLDTYYKYLDTFLNELYVIHRNFSLWGYVVKGIDDFKYENIGDGYYYYYANLYKKEHGKYPTVSVTEEFFESNVYMPDIIGKYHHLYDEFSMSDQYGLQHLSYLLSDEDYIALSRRCDDLAPEEQTYGLPTYTLVRSTDPEMTEAWLNELVAYKTHTYEQVLVTPESLYDEIATEAISSGVGTLVGIAIVLAVMSACMYFIMRSSLFSRIKEIGIYRAIGVSKRNLIFRFFTEALAIATSTVLIGYFAATAFIYFNLWISPKGFELFYYPVWMALFVLLFLYGICVIFGILPIASLLRKTPSEILAKYDI
jgi:ABC-type lipoprotein export system ATPase subunit